MEKQLIYIYSPNQTTLSQFINEVPIRKRHLFALLEDRNHLLRVACQSTIVIDKEDLINPLYELGANHVFVGKGFWKELEPLLNTIDPLPSFLQQSNIYSTDPSYLDELRCALRNSQLSGLPLCLRGESGTGKTYLAEKIHTFSGSKGSFVSKNLSEISAALFESELFGHVKGAFTGAQSDKKGLLERVNGGTLFLDEIATLSIEQQAKLLKVIEEKKFSPVGSSKVIHVDFQLITATCENLEELLLENKFRLDFYNRILGIEVTLPSLREQREAIPEVLKLLQKGTSRRLYFTSECLEELRQYDWPGNIRELKTWLKKATLGSQSVIRNAGLSSKKTSKETSQGDNLQIDKELGLPGLIQRIENDLFDKSYKKNKGRPNKICEDLMISKSVFYRLLKEHPSSRLEQIS